MESGAVTTLADLQRGDLVFGPISGAVGAGIGLAEILLAPYRDKLTFKAWWRNRHCGTITQPASADFYLGSVSGGSGVGPMMAQAEPHGYEQIELGREHWTSDWTFIRPSYVGYQANDVAAEADAMVRAKIPYAFEDYAAIAAHRSHLPVPHLDRFISATGPGGLPKRAICSQGVDAQLTLAGIHVLDGKIPQDVVPAELYLWALSAAPALVIRPGKIEIAGPGLVPGPRSVRQHLL
jgi:hypothetical protein